MLKWQLGDRMRPLAGVLTRNEGDAMLEVMPYRRDGRLNDFSFCGERLAVLKAYAFLRRPGEHSGLCIFGIFRNHTCSGLIIASIAVPRSGARICAEEFSRCFAVRLLR